MGSMKTVVGVYLACLGLACGVEVEDARGEYRAAAEPGGGTCDEVYYYVVEGATRDDAQAACDEVCSGVVCADPNQDALACITGNAGDKDSWKCDCKCGCDDEDAACPDAASASML